MSDLTKIESSRYEKSEAALRLSEATKSAILETALDCIITIDHLGLVLDWNPAAERTFGYSRAEAMGREMGELIIPPEMLEMHRRGLARAVETGRDALAGKRVELVAHRKDGVKFPVELAITRISAGAQPIFTGHIRDISERKHAENILRESQQLLASITGNITEAIFRRSLTEGLLFINDAYVKMFGYASAEETRNIPPEKFYADASRRARIVKLLDDADGGFRNEEIEYRRKDGSTFWGLTSAVGIRDETSGRIIYFDGAITDITSRKQIEQRQSAQYAVAHALAESASLDEAAPRILRAVCESLRWDVGVIWQLNGETNELRCVNLWRPPGAKTKIFETATRSKCLPRGVGLPGRIWKTGQPAWISDVLQDTNFPRAPIAAKAGLHAAFGFPISLGNQVLGVIEFFSHAIREPDAQLLKMFESIGSQIGQFVQRKQAEERLQQLNQTLEKRITARTSELASLNAELLDAKKELVKALEQEKELSRLKSNFVNLVSHEFRTPLGVIVSSADILENYFERLIPEQRTGHLQDIRHSTRQMTNLMEEVLLLGKVDAGKMEFKPAPVDILDICQRLVDEQISATARRCPIVLDLKELNGTAKCDEALLRHIFTNLLSNAVKYSPAGKEVRLSGRREGNDAVFEVRDRGLGIPPEDQKHLFEAFHRGQNVSEIPGTGLGLVIVKRCVDLHNGVIEVASEPGRGTTFNVRLKIFAQVSRGKAQPKKKGKKA